MRQFLGFVAVIAAFVAACVFDYHHPRGFAKHPEKPCKVHVKIGACEHTNPDRPY